MKVRSPIPEKKSRLEIIPLIDIMFFLLAAFMMVSLQMQLVRTLKSNLPTATLAVPSDKPDIVNLHVDKDGQVSVDDKPMPFSELFSQLTNRYRANTNVAVFITGAAEATHGEVMFVLDFVKGAGPQRVAIAVNATPEPSMP